MAYIYKITNKLNQKSYIGKTLETIEYRWKQHKHDSQSRIKESRPLYAAMRKYGIENFLIEELEECSADVVNDREIYWINYYDTYHNGYNATLGGDGRPFIDYNLVIQTYKELGAIRWVSEKLHISQDTIRKILRMNNIEITEGKEFARSIQGKKCCMCDLNGNPIQEFETRADGARYLIANNYTTAKDPYKVSSRIGQVCNGQRQTAYGFKWKSV